MSIHKKIFSEDLVDSKKKLLKQLELEAELGWNVVSPPPTGSDLALRRACLILQQEMMTFDDGEEYEDEDTTA